MTPNGFLASSLRVFPICRRSWKLGKFWLKKKRALYAMWIKSSSSFKFRSDDVKKEKVTNSALACYFIKYVLVESEDAFLKLEVMSLIFFSISLRFKERVCLRLIFIMTEEKNSSLAFIIEWH